MNLDVSDWSAIGGIGSAVAGIASAVAAYLSWNISRRSIQFQSDSLIFEREKLVYEHLKSDAERANNSSNGDSGMDWNFAQAANIVKAIESARNRIIDAGIYATTKDCEKFKSFFKSKLAHEITYELEQSQPPDSVMSPKGSSQMGLEIFTLWFTNVEFFNFSMLRPGDLDD